MKSANNVISILCYFRLPSLDFIYCFSYTFSFLIVIVFLHSNHFFNITQNKKCRLTILQEFLFIFIIIRMSLSFNERSIPDSAHLSMHKEHITIIIIVITVIYSNKKSAKKKFILFLHFVFVFHYAFEWLR